MAFFRNILIIDFDNPQANQIKSLILEKSNKLAVFIFTQRLDITEVVLKHKINSVFINSNIGEKNVLYILRFFFMQQKQTEVEIPIFLTTDNISFAKEVLNEFKSKVLDILPSPLDINDVVDKINIAGFGKLNSSSSPTKNNKNVDLEFMNVFITNTKKVICEMGNITDLKHSPPVLMSKLNEPLNIAISSKILISSSFFKGSYFIAFPEQTFFNLYEVVVLEKIQTINDTNKDFASELANIIYGQCKRKFADEGFNLDMVIPSLHLGEIISSVVIVIPFESALGKFYVAVAPGLI